MKLCTENTSATPNTSGFPLKSLLILYENASHADVYIEYMQGFKLLAEWLAPISIPPLPIVKLPRGLCSYEAQKIAQILGIHESIVVQLIIEIWAQKTE